MKKEETNMEFVLVLHEKPVDEGLTRSEAIDMMDMLPEGDEFLPIEINAETHESVAEGFIAMSFAEKLNYDYENSGLNKFIANILDDMNNEREDCTYEFADGQIWLTR
jgi:hypothetical protein